MRHLPAIAISTLLWTAISTSAAAQEARVGIALPNTATVLNIAPRTSKTGPSYETLIANAVKTAKAEQKTVFVYFTGLGCTHRQPLIDNYCEHLHQALVSFELGPILSKYYVFVAASANQDEKHQHLVNPGADSAMVAMGIKTGGTPTYAFLDATGKTIATSMAMPNNGNVGFPDTPPQLKEFEGLLKKSAPQMTDEDRTIIMDYFTKNAEGIQSALAAAERRAAEAKAKK